MVCFVSSRQQHLTASQNIPGGDVCLAPTCPKSVSGGSLIALGLSPISPPEQRSWVNHDQLDALFAAITNKQSATRMRKKRCAHSARNAASPTPRANITAGGGR